MRNIQRTHGELLPPVLYSHSSMLRWPRWCHSAKFLLVFDVLALCTLWSRAPDWLFLHRQCVLQLRFWELASCCMAFQCSCIDRLLSFFLCSYNGLCLWYFYVHVSFTCALFLLCMNLNCQHAYNPSRTHPEHVNFHREYANLIITASVDLLDLSILFAAPGTVHWCWSQLTVTRGKGILFMVQIPMTAYVQNFRPIHVITFYQTLIPPDILITVI